jgi:hypothetical protein
MLLFFLNNLLAIACPSPVKNVYTGHHPEPGNENSLQKNNGPRAKFPAHKLFHFTFKKCNPPYSPGGQDYFCSKGVTLCSLPGKTATSPFLHRQCGVSMVYPVALFQAANLTCRDFQNKPVRIFFQSYHTATPDIRIAIQSFQI